MNISYIDDILFSIVWEKYFIFILKSIPDILVRNIGSLKWSTVIKEVPLWKQWNAFPTRFNFP